MQKLQQDRCCSCCIITSCIPHPTVANGATFSLLRLSSVSVVRVTLLEYNQLLVQLLFPLSLSLLLTLRRVEQREQHTYTILNVTWRGGLLYSLPHLHNTHCSAVTEGGCRSILRYSLFILPYPSPTVPYRTRLVSFSIMSRSYPGLVSIERGRPHFPLLFSLFDPHSLSEYSRIASRHEKGKER